MNGSEVGVGVTVEDGGGKPDRSQVKSSDFVAVAVKEVSRVVGISP